jgi:hypothetical protein
MAQRTGKTWRPTTAVEQLEFLLLGDTSFGENYQEQRASRGRTNVLVEHGYDHGFEHVHDLLEQADLVVANLETPLTTLRTSPFEDIRPWLHYGHPELTTRHLLAHNIRGVTLANNHTHDFGEPGLLHTLEALEANDIMAIGAGRDLDDAREPLRIRAELIDPAKPARSERFRLSLLNAFRGGRQFRDDFEAGLAQVEDALLARDPDLMAEGYERVERWLDWLETNAREVRFPPKPQEP